MQDVNNRHIAVTTGRRFGKTFIIKSDIIWNTFGNNDIQYGYFAPTLKMARSLMWEKLISSIEKRLIKDKNKTDMYIKLWNDSIITMWGAEHYDAARGQGFNIVGLDEAAYMPRQLWEEVLIPTLGTTKGRSRFFTTPKGKSNYYYDLTNDIDFKHIQHTSLEGGWIPEAEIERAQRLLDEKTFRQEYEASFETTGNTVYYMFGDYVNTDYQYNPNLKTVLAWDFNINPLSTILIQEVSKDYWVCTKEFVINNQNTESQCQVIDTFLQATGFTGELLFTGDHTGKSHHTSATRSDWQIIENFFKNYKGYYKKTKPCRSHKDRVMTLNNLFHNSLQGERLKINFKECPKLVRDLRITEWKANGIQIDKREGISDPSDALSYFPFNHYPIVSDKSELFIL